MKHRKLRFFALLLALSMALCACEGAVTPTQTAPTAPSSKPQETLPPAPVSAHKDDDGDEVCDDCGIDVTVELDFYAFNDLHGVFMDTAENPGLDELTTFLKNAYADDSAYEIVLSSGDMWQGTVESSSNKGQLMTEWMNHMGFVSMTLGNHEFDWGSQYIAKNAEIADFPFLGINVTDDNVTESYCQPSVIVERGGVKIGIIGAVGNVLSAISDEYSDGLNFALRSQLTQMVKAEAIRLRQEGCHFIVYSIHAGYEKAYPGIQDITGDLGYYDTDLSQGYIDLVFEAHTHWRYIIRDEHGVYHLQGNSSNKGVSFANVCYNLVTNTYEVETVDILQQGTFADSDLPDDPIVQQMYDRYFPEEDPYEVVLGYNAAYRSSDEIKQTVASQYLEKGREVWGDQYNIVMGGGRINVRYPYNLERGAVTYAQLFSLLPFDNTLVLCELSGRQLREKFVNSNTYYCEPGFLATIADNETYYVVTDTYTSMYEYNQFTEVARLDDTFARDVLKEFVMDGGWDNQSEPISLEKANEIGAALADFETTQQVYEVTGTIVSITNTTYGNIYIQDEQGNTLYLYGLYDADGHRYDAMSDPPQVGDTITVTGAITKYISSGGAVIIEIMNACLK